jgi:hypothetical protein
MSFGEVSWDAKPSAGDNARLYANNAMTAAQMWQQKDDERMKQLMQDYMSMIPQASSAAVGGINATAPDWDAAAAKAAGYYDQAGTAATQNYQNDMGRTSQLIAQKLFDRMRGQGVGAQGPHNEALQRAAQEMTGSTQQGLSNIAAQIAMGKAQAFASSPYAQAQNAAWLNQLKLQNDYQQRMLQEQMAHQAQLYGMKNAYGSGGGGLANIYTTLLGQGAGIFSGQRGGTGTGGASAAAGGMSGYGNDPGMAGPADFSTTGGRQNQYAAATQGLYAKGNPWDLTAANIGMA